MPLRKGLLSPHACHGWRGNTREKFVKTFPAGGGGGRDMLEHYLEESGELTGIKSGHFHGAIKSDPATEMYKWLMEESFSGTKMLLTQ